MIENILRDTIVEVPYGTENKTIVLQPGTLVLKAEEPEVQTSAERFRIDFESSALRSNLDLSQPVLVVTDKTRWCDYPEYLPIVTEIINRFRGKDSPFQIIIAYGTHPRQSDKESLEIYGSLYQRWPFSHHDCSDIALFSEVAVTSSGTPVRLRKDLLEASCIITMGPTCHHYFAGYGGGRKLIFPGCGERQAIFHNHGLFLDRSTGTLSPLCQPGNLTGNPLAEDLFEIESCLSAHLAIHGIPDSTGKICNFLIGSGRTIYLEACAQHGANFEISLAPVDTVVASCGGFPKDINFVQAHKAIHNSAGFVRDGGRLIVFAQCPDNIGSQTFLPWYTADGFNGAFQKLSTLYVGNGGTALAMMSKTRRINIALITDLDQEICAKLDVAKWSPEKTESVLHKSTGRTAWIRNAGLLINKPAS